MSNEERKGKKRSKAFYRKSVYGAKKHCGGSNILEPGIRGFLVMCNSNESSAVRESYNILNEYADLLYGQEQIKPKSAPSDGVAASDDEDCDDIEKALKKEVDGLKSTTPAQRRFQNVSTKAKNCVFIRTTVEDPVRIVVRVMEDIAEKGLRKARYAARILPIIGTCKAHTVDIEKLAKDVLTPVFSRDNPTVPVSYTILFKARNNNGNTCGKTSVIPTLTRVVSEINPEVKFSWTDFDVAVLVEVVCTVCCLGVAPDYTRLRKYNLQELQQGPKVTGGPAKAEDRENTVKLSETENVSKKVTETEGSSEKQTETEASDTLQQEENGDDCESKADNSVSTERQQNSVIISESDNLDQSGISNQCTQDTVVSLSES